MIITKGGNAWMGVHKRDASFRLWGFFTIDRGHFWAFVSVYVMHQPALFGRFGCVLL